MKRINQNYVCRCGHSSHSHFLMRGRCDHAKKCKCRCFRWSKIILTLPIDGPLLDDTTVASINDTLVQAFREREDGA